MIRWWFETLMFPSRDHVKKLGDYMNKKHPNIRFKFEIEDQNSFPFWDMKIIRNNEKKAFETSVYRKSAFSGIFTNFKSFIPKSLFLYKTGLLETVILLFFNLLFLWKVSRGNCQTQGNL